MGELLLLLIGGPTIRRRWWAVAVAGLLAFSIGLFFAINALYDEFRIPPTYFAIPLFIDAAITLVAGVHGTATSRALRIGQALTLIIVGILIIEAPWHSDAVIGILIGMILVADAVWRAAGALVVRFARWRTALVLAGFEFVIGVWSFVPWPTQWRGAVGIDVGVLLMVIGVTALVLAARIRRLPKGAPLAVIMAKTRPEDGHDPLIYPVDAPPGGRTGELVVHVWTPTGTLSPLNHGISRYVAAQDDHGVVSTGHASMELLPDLYISHYPSVEIDHSPEEFARILRATPENDVPGLFKPSYAEESAEWCPSTREVSLHAINGAAVRAFWAVYRVDTTYNLTYRNCSSTVAGALDAAIEGHIGDRIYSPRVFLRLLLLPELWVAGLMRRRAAWMAWTPGLVLDYSRALSQILTVVPPSRPAA